MVSPLWFSRLADIPKVGYTGGKPVERTRLVGHNARPRRESSAREEHPYESLWWEYGGITTSASPASRHKAPVKPSESERSHLLRQLAEILELPGTPSNYHFAIQNVQNELWNRRLDEPGVLETLEGLCWLNIRLLEACPEALLMGDPPSYPRLAAFGYLLKILEREGYLHEALEVARRAQSFGQMEGSFEALSARIAAMEAEQ